MSFRRSLFITLSIICSFILLLLLLLFIFRLLVLRWAIKGIGKQTGVEIVTGEIRGNLFSSLYVSDLKVSFSKASFTAKSVYLQYNLISLLQKKKEITLLSVEEPRLTLRQERKLQVEEVGRESEFPSLRIPLSLRVGKFFLRKAAIPDIFSYGRYAPAQVIGSFDLEGKIWLEPAGIKIPEGRLSTPQGDMSFGLSYTLNQQQGELNISSLSFKSDYGKIYLRGSIAVSFGIPRIQGEVFSIFTPRLAIKDLSLPPCSLQFKFKDTMVFYSATSSSELGNLRITGSLSLFDTAYNCTLNLSPLNVQKFWLVATQGRASVIPIPLLSGELQVSGKGRKEISFRTVFRRSAPVQGLRYDSLYFRGKVTGIFEKEPMLLIQEGKVLKAGRVFSLAGEVARRKVNIIFQADNFSLSRGDIPFGIFKGVEGKIDGWGEVKGNFDSIYLATSLGVSHLSVATNLFINSCSLNIRSPNVRSLAGKAEMKLFGVKWQKNACDSVNFSIKNMDINLGIYKSQDTTLQVTGRLSNFSVAPLAGKVTSPAFSCIFHKLILRLGGDSIFNEREFEISRVRDSLFLKNLSLRFAEGQIAADLFLHASTLPRGRIQIKNISLGQIARFALAQVNARFALAQVKVKDDEVNGTLNATILSDTVVSSAVEVKNLVIKKEDINIKKIECQITIKGQRIELVDVSIYKDEKRTHLSGNIDIDRGKIINWDISATLNDPGVWVFSFLRKTLHLQEGKIFGQVNLRGNLNNPIFDGRVRIYKGKLLFPILGVGIKEFACELSLFKERIILLEGKGKVEQGEITGTGFVNLRDFTSIDTLHYDLELNSIPLNLEKGIFGVFDGRLAIDWTPLIPLKLSGDFSVVEGLITLPFGKKTYVQPKKEEEVEFDFKITGDKGIWLRNPSADLELGINLQISRKKEAMTLVGELIVRKGELYYLDRTLRMKEGKIIFDNITEIDPQLELRAELETKPIRVGENPPQRFQIIFLLQGTLSQPKFKLLSEPPLLSEKDIITYLTLNISPEEMKVIAEREFFYSALSERLLSYFEREVARKLRGYLSLDYLSLEQKAWKETKITVGKYLAKNLYLTYAAIMGGEERDEFKAEYYITRKHILSGEKTGEGRYILKYQFQIRY